MNKLYNDTSFILNALCYTDLDKSEKDEIKTEANRIYNKLGRRERITDREIKWVEETNTKVSKHF
jgi:hypothetical protein